MSHPAEVNGPSPQLAITTEYARFQNFSPSTQSITIEQDTIPLPPLLDNTTANRLIARLQRYTSSDTSDHSDSNQSKSSDAQVIAFGNLSHKTNHADFLYQKMRKESFVDSEEAAQMSEKGNPIVLVGLFTVLLIPLTTVLVIYVC